VIALQSASTDDCQPASKTFRSGHVRRGRNGNAGPPWCAIPINYSSRAWSPGIVIGAGYNVGRSTIAFTVRNAPDRGIDTSWNKHDDMPSGVKQCVANFSIRYSF